MSIFLWARPQRPEAVAPVLGLMGEASTNSEPQGSDRRGPEGRGRRSDNSPLTLPVAPAPHPRSGAKGPAPPWVPNRKHVKLKVTQAHHDFYCSWSYAPGNSSATFGSLPVHRAGSVALSWRQPFGVLIQQRRGFLGAAMGGSHHSVKADEVRNGGGTGRSLF